MLRATRTISMALIVFGVLAVSAVQPTHNFSEKTVPELLRLLEDSDANVRHCSAIFIGARYRNPKKVVINGPIQKPKSPAPEFPIPIQVIPALAAHLKTDKDWAVRVCSLMALQELRFHANTTSFVALALDDKDTLMRVRACSALIEISHDFSEPLHAKVVPTLIGCLDPKGEVEHIWQGAYAAEKLGTNGTAVVPALRTLAAHESEKVRHYADRALLQIEPESKK